MQSKKHTLWHTMGIVLAFVSFLMIFGALGVAMLIIGIYWAFQVFFTVGWWASLLIMLGLLVVYVTALSFALELIRGENE